MKLPGVHWRAASDRLAELNAGIITTDNNKQDFGYDNILNMLAEINSLQAKRQGAEIVLHFTCLEMDDQPDSQASSLAKSMVFLMGANANRRGITIKGENALAGSLYSDRGWENIENVLEWSHYSGITILRMGDVLRSEIGRQRYPDLRRRF